MNHFVLTGFAALSPETPSFLIPYFVRPGSDQTFAQELDEHFRIKQFQPFALSQYEHIRFEPEPLRRSAGEIGVLAFAKGEEEVCYDTPANVRIELQKIERTGDPFFDLEASQFLGNTNAVRMAIQRTANSFKSIKVLTAWVRVEMNLLAGRSVGRVTEVARPRPPPLAESMIGILSSGKMSDFILADMQEQFDLDVTRMGKTLAQTRYWGMALRTAAPLAGHVLATTIGMTQIIHSAFSLFSKILGR
jgi:hypothetical protein